MPRIDVNSSLYASSTLIPPKPQSGLAFTGLPYSPFLAHYFSRMAQLPWAMVLHSNHPQNGEQPVHPNSRFDILVADPLACVLTYPDHSELSYWPSNPTNATMAYESPAQLSHEIHQQTPFTLLRELQQRFCPDISLSTLPDTLQKLPFIGGSLGYWTYDLGVNAMPVQRQLNTDIPIADMAVGFYDWAIVIDHSLQQSYLIAPQATLDARLAWWNALPTPDLTPFSTTSDWQSNMTKPSYAQAFQQVQHHIFEGDCYQINLTQRFQCGYQGSEWQAYQRLTAHNRAPFSAFINTPECRIMSVSPERFISVNQRDIETKPIKGTAARHPNDPLADQHAQLTLQQSSKDRAENLMIVDLLRNDIGQVARIGSVKVPKLFHVESFPAVHHLVSTIQAQLADNYDAFDVFSACFPGGSITGAPKISAMQIIENIEPNRRSLYCGSIGYFSRHGKLDSNICIRTVIAYNEQLFVWGGGGIVFDSEVSAEYQESLDKLSKILPILQNY